MQPTLHTDRLVLRPFQDADASDVQRLAGDAAVADTALAIPHPFEDGMAEAWIAMHAPGYEAGELAIFAITDRSAGELIGGVGLSMNAEHARGELGYWIGRPYWGRGYATEAARAVVAFGFEQLRLHRIHADHFTRNPASGRVLTKLGMRREGLLREHAMHQGRPEDLVVYGILATEYPVADS